MARRTAPTHSVIETRLRDADRPGNLRFEGRRPLHGHMDRPVEVSAIPGTRNDPAEAGPRRTRWTSHSETSDRAAVTCLFHVSLSASLTSWVRNPSAETSSPHAAQADRPHSALEADNMRSDVDKSVLHPLYSHSSSVDSVAVTSRLEAAMLSNGEG